MIRWQNAEPTARAIYEKEAMERAGGIDFSRSGEYTVAEWCRLWFDTYAKPAIRGTTAAGYRNSIENHIVPAIGEIKLEKLTAMEIQKMYNQTKTEGWVPRYNAMKSASLSNCSVRGIHMVLHGALEQAVAERLISSNPTNGCRIPKIEKKKMKVIPPEKIGAYLKSAEARVCFACSIWNYPAVCGEARCRHYSGGI